MVEMSNTGGMKVGAAKQGKIAKNGEYILIYAKSDEHASVVRTPLYDFVPGFDTHFNLFKSDDGSIKQLGDVLAQDETVKNELVKYGINKVTLQKFAEYYDKSDVLQNYVLENITRIVRPRSEVPNIPNSLDLNSKTWIEFKSDKRKQPYYLTLDNDEKPQQLVPIALSYRTTDDFQQRFGRSVIRGDFWKGFWIDMGNIVKEGNIGFKNGKKPLRLIVQLIKWSIKTSPDSIVLDFFSGSATTAHAVMLQNAEDGGKRKFIMVQLPEKTPEGSEASKAGYKTIAEIGRERIRRASAKIKTDYADKLAAREFPLDTGFRAYTVADTAFLDVERHPTELEQGQLLELANNIKSDRTPEDLLTQVMLGLGLTLDLPIETKQVDVNTVFYVAGNALVACFDEAIPTTLIDEMAKCQPLQVAFKDGSFGSDDALINAETHLKRLSPDTILSVI